MTKQRRVQIIGLVFIGGFWLIASRFIGSWQDFAAAVGCFSLLLAVAMSQNDSKEPPRG